LQRVRREVVAATKRSRAAMQVDTGTFLGWSKEVGEEAGVWNSNTQHTTHAPGLRVSGHGIAHAQSMTERLRKDVLDSNWKTVKRVDRIRQ
jgi:hypothetical protein